jgi:hypothetical protein
MRRTHRIVAVLFPPVSSAASKLTDGHGSGKSEINELVKRIIDPITSDNFRLPGTAQFGGPSSNGLATRLRHSYVFLISWCRNIISIQQRLRSSQLRSIIPEEAGFG